MTPDKAAKELNKKELDFHRIYDKEGNEVECIQKSVIQRIFDLYMNIAPKIEDLHDKFIISGLDDDYQHKDIEKLDKRVENVEKEIKKKADKEDLKDIEYKYDRMFWLILAFFLIFLIKTFIWKY